MIEYVTFQSFYSEEEANNLAALLEENDIRTKIIRGKMIDKVLVGDGLEKNIYLNIKNSDFKKANEILEQTITDHLSEIGDDYYLYSFSDKELLEIINQPDEWSKQDFIIARKILDDRGIPISQKSIEEIKLKRTFELARYEPVHGSYIFLGYILAFLGGYMGLFFGLPYMQAKKILPNGSKVYVFDDNTRHHGKNIFIISCIMLVFWSLVTYRSTFY